MARWTVRWLKHIDPSRRLLWAARIFWLSILFGLISVVFLCNGWFEKVLMAISWGAITVTAVDIVCTSDVRDEAES